MRLFTFLLPNSRVQEGTGIFGNFPAFDFVVERVLRNIVGIHRARSVNLAEEFEKKAMAIR